MKHGSALTPIPATVLTGYLGAGKTTLLKRILSAHDGRRYAVIVNEFAELGIDADLILNAEEEVITLNNGCLCCSVRSDLLRTLKSVVARGAVLDGIVIETTGLADPAPIAQTFFMDPQLSAGVRLDAIVTVADARHLSASLAGGSEAEAQLAVADLVLLNKSDLVSPEELNRAELMIRALNGAADIRRTLRSDIAISEVLHRNAFSLHRVIERLPTFMSIRARHAGMIESESLQTDRPLSLERFLRWVYNLLASRGDEILRVKGILNVEGELRRFVFQAVHRIADGDFIDAWLPGERRSKLVVIGRNIDRERLRRNFEGCSVTRPL